MSEHKENLREEVKREFQLERMILFSDAVFAIVITLMAIEIKLPEGLHLGANIGTTRALHLLLPAILAYAISFFVIGAIWYRHLRLFSVLKDYDGGLVFRNLALLFFIGLFPFSVSLFTHAKGSALSYGLYLGMIYCCLVAQFVLQRYILLSRPGLRSGVDISEHLHRLHRTTVLVIAFGVSITLIFTTRHFLTDPDTKNMATWWILLVPLSVRLFAEKKAVGVKA
ncbi:MAG TPA: TMEM175 family protein [Flavobacteriales bacterium]|nr:TMEM175 family protein [Flavobacteriales bacterium]